MHLKAFKPTRSFSERIDESNYLMKGKPINFPLLTVGDIYLNIYLLTREGIALGADVISNIGFEEFEGTSYALRFEPCGHRMSQMCETPSGSRYFFRTI